MSRIFRFENQDVRLIGTAERPEWIAKDICRVLEISDVSNALKNLDADEKGTHIVRTLGGNQSLLTINESGLYSLVLRSRKPQAKKFKKWVTSEVLPAIRQTGHYSLANPKSQAQTQFPKTAIEIAAECLKEAGISDQQSQLWKLDQYSKYSQGAEKLVFSEAKKLIANGAELPTLPLSPTEVGQRVGEKLGKDALSARKINLLLIECGLQIPIEKISKKSGRKKKVYDLTDLGRQHGHLELTSAKHSDGTVVTQVRWFESVVEILTEYLLLKAQKRD